MIPTRFEHPLTTLLTVFDLAGTFVFALSGATKAGPVAAILFGTLTGIGGGMVRDVLAREIPTVLRTDVYALAAIIGATILVGARSLHLTQAVASILGAVICTEIRLGAMHYGWRLPSADPRRPSAADKKRE